MSATDEDNARADFANAQLLFRALRESPSGIDADPSGWRDTVSDVEEMVPQPRLAPGDLVQYHADAVHGLASYGEPIVSLINRWEDREYSPQQVTLCPSGTSASLAILIVLRDLGVKTVVFETPLYFASLDQARALGLEPRILRTFRATGYQVAWDGLPVDSESTAFWFTQPRAALGFDQTSETLGRLLESLRRERQYLIIDEVTEQRFPATLRDLVAQDNKGCLIRIRSFTKGMGLNGIRLAAILHPAELKRHFVRTLDAFGGSVDVFSLATVAGLARESARFKAMLAAANTQVVNLRERAERLGSSSIAQVNHLVNGYIGSMIVDLTRLGSDQNTRRRAFLAKCLQARTPVVLGSSYSLASDPPFEMVRINFLIGPDSVLRGIGNIMDVLDS